MDELKAIRDLLPPPTPPSDRVVEEVRARLTDEPASLRRKPRLVFPLATAAAAVVAAALVISVISAGDGEQESARDQGTEQAAPRSARDILLVAADRAAADAEETGRFWRVRTVTGAVVPNGPFGTAPNTYDLERRVVVEAWLSADGHEPDWTGQRNAGAHPTNEAAWRADGAPTEWNLGYDAELGRDNVLSNRPDAGTLIERSPLQQVLPGMTAQQVRDLPTDAGELRAYLVEHRAVQRDEPQDPDALAQVVDAYLFNRAVMLLGEVPAPPGVRAAALRLIADLGGVEKTGTVTDPLGRPGIGITLVTRTGKWADTAELVVDASTGTLLGSRHIGTEEDTVVKQSYFAVVSSSWTDAAPAIPSAEIR
jgi:hypothetical protein